MSEVFWWGDFIEGYVISFSFWKGINWRSSSLKDMIGLI
jgi:hypothetical protein